MMGREVESNRDQIEMLSLEELVPAGHLVRKTENATLTQVRFQAA